MYQEAVSKLKNEIEQSKNNPYVQVVGNFLLGHLEHHHEDAEKIIATDKSIIKSLDEMRKAASKKKVGNCAIFTPEEGFSIAMQYFGINSAVAPESVIAVNKKTSTEKSKSEVDFNISLDDFLI